MSDAEYMSAVLDLARQGTALASPNPRVGALIVRDGVILGRGCHRYAGRLHAERLALDEAIGEAGIHAAAVRGATLYVNLEPCSHVGRTPPCADAIVEAGIARLVAAMADPNPQVAGRGFSLLRQAGIAVEVGCLEAEARRLNQDFAQWITTGRPFVTLKSALSRNGYLAPAPHKRAPGLGPSPGPHWLSGEPARAKVQALRHECDAILTGIGTVEADDPRLTDRTGLPRRRPLMRAVLDSQLRISPQSQLVRGGDLTVFCQSPEMGPHMAKDRAKDMSIDTAKDMATYRATDIATATAAHESGARGFSSRRDALQAAGVRIVEVPGGPRGLDLNAVLQSLGGEQIISVLLEAGSRLNRAMLSAALVDKMTLFYAPRDLDPDSLPFAAGLKPPTLDEALEDESGATATPIGDDLEVETYLHD